MTEIESCTTEPATDTPNVAQSITDLSHFVSLASGSATSSARISEINSDQDIDSSLNQGLLNNSVQYTRALTTYVDNAEFNLKAKRMYKSCFFIIAIIILIVSFVFSLCIIAKIYTSDLAVASKLTESVTPIVTLLAPLFILPHAITKYLFTTKDEDDMKEILKTILLHDEGMLNIRK